MRLDPKQLRERAAQARKLQSPCRLCPRACGADRLANETGLCRAGRLVPLASWGPHHGEEGPLSGWNGSGTVFFGGCPLACVFCQNWDISQAGRWEEVSVRELAAVFLRVQAARCHNLNLVTPTHVVADILEALALAVEQGFRLPVVYNTGGYDSVETLELLEGVVDIYMPDAKYMDSKVGRDLSGVPDYPQRMQEALCEMHRQVGDLVLDAEGLAVRGLLVRHLVLPGGLAGTRELAAFLAERISRNTYVNVMAQYRPCHRAWEQETYPELGRRPTAEEMAEAYAAFLEAGITRFDEPRWLA